MNHVTVRCGLVFACVLLATGVFGVSGLAVGSSPRQPAPSANGLDANGGFVVAGRPRFLIALSNPPPLSGRTPSGLSGLAEVVHAGVNLMRVGPGWTGWTSLELERVLAWERAAVRLRVHLWVRLNAFAATEANWRGDAHLAAIVHALTRSRFAAGVGLWQGADEPWSRGISAGSLAFFYCRLSARRDRRACDGEPPLDRHHPVVTILAPSGTPTELAPFSAVSDGLGVDIYPVTLNNADSPNLHMVGVWTRKIAGITRNHSVWTTLEICPNYTPHAGPHVLPSAYQERYMIYDAIINGARGLAFFGGDNPLCWNRIDRRYRWNWTFWNGSLEPSIEQISSPLALGPAVNDAASNHVLHTNDAGMEAISRIATTPSGRQLWVIAARNDPGAKRVAISGLPASTRSAAVYGERRTVLISDGTLTDTFRQWQVHLYRIQLAASKR